MHKKYILYKYISKQNTDDTKCKIWKLKLTRKATGFKSLSNLLGDRSGSIKIPKNVLDKTCKKSSKTDKMNITIKFYIFKIVLVPNFKLN